MPKMLDINNIRLNGLLEHVYFFKLTDLTYNLYISLNFKTCELSNFSSSLRTEIVAMQQTSFHNKV